MTTLRMQTETVRVLAEKLTIVSQEIGDHLQYIRSTAESAEWAGPNYDAFCVEMQGITQVATQQIEAGILLAQRVEREVVEWEQIGVLSGPVFASIMGNINNFRKYFDKIKSNSREISLERQYNTGNKEQKAEFSGWWKTLSTEERQVFIKNQLDQYSEKNNLPKMDLQIVDLPDTDGDARGVHFENTVQLDSDNFRDSSPFEILQTTLHEARHEYQETLVEKYNQTGELPKDVSKEIMEEWKNNMKKDEKGNLVNYIQPRDDPVGYFEQPIERDARISSTSFIINFLENRKWVKPVIVDPIPPSPNA